LAEVPPVFQRVGYLISIVSLGLFSIVAWASNEEPWLRAAVALGLLTGIGGMAMRWISFEREEKPHGPVDASARSEMAARPLRSRGGLAR
jgi:hypothetical protein